MALDIGEAYLPIVVKALFVLVIALFLYLIIILVFNRSLRKLQKKNDIEQRKMMETRLNFFKIILIYLIFIVSGVYILFLIPGFRTFTISLLAGAGIIAVIIGFAAQKTLANIIAGISVAIYTPFRIGDRIKVGEEFGDVEEMNFRHTVLKTWDNRRVVIPNVVIAEKEIVNYSIKDEKVLWTVNMGIGYDSDIDKAKKIMIAQAKKHPDVITPDVKNEKGEIEREEPYVYVTECGESAVNLRLYFWVEKPSKGWVTGFALTEKIKKEFDKNGIEIPFPYRTIVYKKDLERKKRKY